MGVENHKALIAVTWDSKAFNEIYDWVSNLPESDWSRFSFIPAIYNFKQTIFMAPSGLEVGGVLENHFDELRNQLITIIQGFSYEDGSNPFKWVEIGFGELGQQILRGNCEDMYGGQIDM